MLESRYLPLMRYPFAIEQLSVVEFKLVQKRQFENKPQTYQRFNELRNYKFKQ